jgi:uncharacterized membrane protein
MASGSQLANQAQKSRTSIVFLILSAASIYYSTQIHLNHTLNGLALLIPVSIAGAGIIFIIVALFLLYQDYQYESEYRELRKREKRADVLSKEAEVEEIQADQAKAKQEEEQAANIVEEGGAL